MAPNTPTKTATITINTTTDNPTGYNTTLSTNHATNTCLLRSTDTDCSTTTTKISPVTGTVPSPDTLDPNQWGATLATTFTNLDKGDDSVWFQVPNQNSSVIINTTTIPTPATGDDQDLTFGTKASYSLIAGNYSNTVVITAVANAYNTAPTITSISPNSGEPSSNESITITGTNFT
ncbi:MAG: IPT/TIG domain-containing protein, partial [Candidatus Nomurabacteria bacterium]|nr:IPT/TIG domain-containing protein [Candidatus Nomurabacteria bacterium]